VRLDWDNPYTDVEANYQVCVYFALLLIKVHNIQMDEVYALWTTRSR